MTRWLAAACATGRDADTPAWALLENREPAHVVLTGHRGPVTGLTLLTSADGPAFASTGTDATIRIWDPLTGRPARADIATGTRQAVIKSLGNRLVGIDDEGILRLWDWRTGSLLETSAAVDRRTGRALLAVAGDLVCAGTARGPLARYLNFDYLAYQGKLESRGGVRTVAGVPFLRRPLLLTGSDDGLLRLVDGDEEVSSSRLGAGVEQVCVAGRAILATTDDHQVAEVTIDPRTYEMRATVLGNIVLRDPAAPIAYIPDSDMIAAADDSGLIRLWRRPSAGMSRAEGTEAPGRAERMRAAWAGAGTMAGHAGAIYDLATVRTADGRRVLVSAGADWTVRLWHPDPRPVGAAASLGRITAVGPLSRGRVAIGTDSGSIRAVDPATGDVEDGLALNAVRTVYAIAESETDDGPVLASAGTQIGIRLWNLQTGRYSTDRLNRHSATVRCLLAYRNANGDHRIASGADDGVVRLWNPAGRFLTTPPKQRGGPIRHLAAAPRSPAAREETSPRDKTGPHEEDSPREDANPSGAKPREEASPSGKAAPSGEAEPREEGVARGFLAAGSEDGTLTVWWEAEPDRHEAWLSEAGAAIAGLLVGGHGGLIVVRSDGLLKTWSPAWDTSSERHLGSTEPIVSATRLRLAAGELLALGTAASEIRLVEAGSLATVRTTLLPMGLVARQLTFVSNRLLARTDRGLLGWALDPRIGEDQRVNSERLQRGNRGT